MKTPDKNNTFKSENRRMDFDFPVHNGFLSIATLPLAWLRPGIVLRQAVFE